MHVSLVEARAAVRAMVETPHRATIQGLCGITGLQIVLTMDRNRVSKVMNGLLASLRHRT